MKKRRWTALLLSGCFAVSLCLPTAQAAETELPLTLVQVHTKYMRGFEDGTFRPNDTLTRAQAVQMVYRLIEYPDRGTGTCSYTDLVSGAWYVQPVQALCRLGLLEDGETFRPEDPMTRADFVLLLSHLTDETTGTVTFPDVPDSDPAANAISVAATLGWVSGYPDGTFQPEGNLTRAEACTILNRVTNRTGDSAQISRLLALGLFPDVSPDFWAATAIGEAAVSHTPTGTGTGETWNEVDLSTLNLTPGFHGTDSALYYVNPDGKLVTNTTLGAYTADGTGKLTQTLSAYAIPYVPYYSQIDNIYAWVGCEAVSALMGLKSKGYAQGTELKTFLDNLPRSATNNPETGFVGSPYVPDKTKKTRTTIYPAKLAEYCNQFCGKTACADFRGMSIEEVRRELLAGNCIVGYMTLWWNKPAYRDYVIEGQTQRLVSNNHAVLLCGYDPEQGYRISDPYNYYNRGQVYQYWKDAATIESIWNERQVGMVIR